MFICETCISKPENDCGYHHFTARSYGSCELCGFQGRCVDCKHPLSDKAKAIREQMKADKMGNSSADFCMECHGGTLHKINYPKGTAPLLLVAKNKIGQPAEQSKLMVCKSNGSPYVVFVSGGMSVYPNYNADAFDATTARLRQLGFTTITPTEYVDKLMSFEGEVLWEKAMKLALVDIIQKADALALLPEWEKSKGSTMEVMIAKTLGLDILDSVTMLPINVEVSHTAWEVKPDALQG